MFCSEFSSIINLENEHSVAQNEHIYYTRNSKPPLTYGLYSAIIPGMGQYMINRKYPQKVKKSRAFIFFGIEIVTWISSYSYKQQYHKQVSKYQDYADSDVGWDFERWVKGYDSFMTNYEDVWVSGIGTGSHSVEFYYNGTLTSTTSDQFSSIQGEIENYSGENFYSDFSIEIVKDQHFYENIGKYNEFFPGWSDSEHISFVTTKQGYVTARSPYKNKYIESYNKAEEYSDYSEIAALCIYFNHFVSMLDAFILARKYNGDIMATSSTVYDRNSSKMPIGVNLKLILSL